MIATYKALRDLIDTKLNDNPNGILFDTTLFDSKKLSYTKTTFNTDNYGTTKKKCIPAHIEDITGEFINIPNTNVFTGGIGLTFDLFVRDSSNLETPQLQDLFSSVSYTESMLAIENLRKELLANYFPLGDSGLFFGGTDSTGTFELDSGIKFNTIYLQIDFKDTSSSDILFTELSTVDYLLLDKDDTNITLYSVVNNNSVQVSVPYSTGLNDIYVYYDNTSWNLNVNGVNASVVQNVTQNIYDLVLVSRLSDLYGVIYQLLIDDSIFDPTDIGKTIEEVIAEPQINLKDFDSRYSFNQLGTVGIANTNFVENCILWGKDGNAVFGFETLVPISNLRYQDDGYARQIYALGINLMVSFDTIFGNLFEHYLDGELVIPLDKQDTYSADLSSDQYIGEKFVKSIAKGNVKDKQQTFFVTSDKFITKLMKQIVRNDQEENKVYTLKIQYPFFSETYSVVIDSGGLSTNINQLATITVTYKQKDDNIT